MSGWYWIGVGLALAIGEAFVPGITLIWLGGAAVVVGLVSLGWPGLDWSIQAPLFAVLAVAAAATGIWLRNRTGQPLTPQVNQGTARFIGQQAALDMPIVNGRGQIRLGDGVWPVTGPDLPAGISVRVTGTDGTTLQVTAVP